MKETKRTDVLKVSDVKEAVYNALRPLPIDSMDFTTCSRDDVLQTVAYLDEVIEAEKEHIEYLDMQRTILLTRAQVEDITTSGRYYLITTPGPLNRNKIDVKKFAERFPEAFVAVRAQQVLNLEAKLGKDVVTEFVGFQPQTVKAEVRKMPELLK
jgi:hypothetical protein